MTEKYEGSTRLYQRGIINYAEVQRILRMMERAKAAYSYLKEIGAPDDYVQGVLDLIQSWEQIDSENSRLADDNDDLRKENAGNVEEIQRLSNTLATFERSVKDAADDLAEASRAIQKLV